MWTAINISAHPIWDSLQYRVVLTWVEDDLTEPVVLVKEGILDVGYDTTPEAMLLRLVRRLETEATMPGPSTNK